MRGPRVTRMLLGLAALLPAAAQAGDGTPWRCWYNAPAHITCARPPQLPGQRYLHIPLHTIPFDLRHVETLARAVICGANAAGCGMQFTARMPIEELDRQADPLVAARD